MANYVKSWYKDGVLYKLQFVPYDEQINPSPTALTGAAIIATEVGPVETAFNDIPYGVVKPPSMKLNLCLTDLPSDMALDIRTKQAGTARSPRNLFLFFSDRGTGGTYTLEFCGVQAKIAGTEYRYESGKRFVEVELVDALYFGMVCTQMSALESNTLSTATRYGTLYDVAFPSAVQSDAYHDSRISATGWSDKFTLTPWYLLLALVREKISFTTKSVATRTGNIAAAADNTDADFGSAWINDILGYCIEFYKCSTSYPRTQGAALTGITTQLITKVFSADGLNVIGGMTASPDVYGWAGYTTAWDWAQDFFETTNCKASYKPVFNAGAGNPYITWTWSCKAVLASVSGTAKTLDLDTALAEPNVVEAMNAAGIVETRIETEGSDVKEWKVNAGVSRADRSFTLRANSLHNLPTVKADSVLGNVGLADAVSYGLFQTNLVCYSDGGDAIKVHEDVRLWKDASTSTLYEATDGVDNLSETPPNFAPGTTGLATYNLWVNAVQSFGGLPYAIAQHIASVFGNDNVSTFDVDVRIKGNYTKVLNDNVGEIFDLSSSSIATDLAHLNWAFAVLTGVKADHMKGVATLTFTLVP